MKKNTPLFQTIPKDFINQAVNEDRIRCENNFIAIADGAGGTGMYCGEWAEFLLSNLPNEPITNFEDFKNWFIELQEPFLAKHEPYGNIDGHIKRRFYEEGSSATLAVVWQVENEYHWLCYGDSQIFFFYQNNMKAFPFKSSAEFETATQLLNWMNLPDEIAFLTGAIPIADCKIILATDTIAKHIFTLLENNTDQQSVFKKIQKILKTSTKTISYIKAQPQIGEDDYSIISWQPNI
jgi:hypothetical protein